MKRFVLILLAFLSVCLFKSEVQACSCAEYGTPVCAEFWSADTVFAGQITDIKVVKDTDGHDARRLNLVVDQPFKGVTGVQVAVYTSSGTSCDRPFHKGKRYLVYAWRGANDRLYTGACSRTTSLETAQEDLDYLRKVAHEGAGESVSGQIQLERYQNLPGLRITAEGAGKTLETTTDEEGKFNVSLPGPGTFKVRVFAPFAAAAMRLVEGPTLKEDATDTQTIVEYELKLAKNQCYYSELSLFKINLHATAQIAGYVLTESGQPLERGSIDLVSAAKPEGSGRSEMLEADGSFHFRNLPPGEYYLVMNPRNEAPDDYDAPYPRTYFPGVSNISDATKIVLTEDATLNNVTLRLGQPMRERIVSGTVSWHDGRAFQNPHLSLYVNTKYLDRIKVDKNGNFSFKIYGDFMYVIVAKEDGEPGAESERLVLIDEKTTGLKLIIRPAKKK